MGYTGGVKRSAQDGYALLVILLALSVFVIGLAAAVPAWKTQIQREREARSIDHAREYRTAIKRYFHKNGRYPASLDVLLQKDGNGIRYLRQEWPDPLNAKADGAWQVLHYGEAVNAEIVDQAPAAASSSGTAAGTAGSSLPGFAAGGSTAGASGLPTPGGIGTQPPGAVGGGFGQAPGLTGGATQGSATTVGGGPVIGVASLNKLPAVHAFNGFAVPNDWQFVYNYAQDPSLRAGVPATGGGLPTGGQPGGSPLPPSGPGH